MLSGSRVPLLFLPSHRTSGRRSEEMYKRSKGNSGRPWRLRSPCRGCAIPAGLWTPGLSVPSRSLPLLLPITSVQWGQERGRGASCLEQLYTQGTTAKAKRPPLPCRLCSPVHQAGPREETLNEKKALDVERNSPNCGRHRRVKTST